MKRLDLFQVYVGKVGLVLSAGGIRWGKKKTSPKESLTGDYAPVEWTSVSVDPVDVYSSFLTDTKPKKKRRKASKRK